MHFLSLSGSFVQGVTIFFGIEMNEMVLFINSINGLLNGKAIERVEEHGIKRLVYIAVPGAFFESQWQTTIQVFIC